jgi:hypothetical protein
VPIGPPRGSGEDPAGDRLATRVARICIGSRPARARIYDVPVMTDEASPLSRQDQPLASDASSFLESLMDTELYSIGAFFCDEHPDLVDEVVARSEAIERSGLEAYSRQNGGPIEESFETLLTGLAVRYYKAVAG